MPNKRVLSIDPGFDRIGVALMEETRGKESLLYSTCIETDRKAPREERLRAIGEKIRELIEEWGPGELSIEKLFFNRNITSGLGVAEARGIILYEAAQAGLRVYEYGPQAVKMAVAGYGKADKSQIENMVVKIMGLKNNPQKKILDDELDAIALGITHLASRKAI